MPGSQVRVAPGLTAPATCGGAVLAGAAGTWSGADAAVPDAAPAFAVTDARARGRRRRPKPRSWRRRRPGIAVPSRSRRRRPESCAGDHVPGEQVSVLPAPAFPPPQAGSCSPIAAAAVASTVAWIGTIWPLSEPLPGASNALRALGNWRREVADAVLAVRAGLDRRVAVVGRLRNAIRSPGRTASAVVNGPTTASVPVALDAAAGALVATARQLVPPAGRRTRRTNRLPLLTPALRNRHDTIVPAAGGAGLVAAGRIALEDRDVLAEEVGGAAAR